MIEILSEGFVCLYVFLGILKVDFPNPENTASAFYVY